MWLLTNFLVHENTLNGTILVKNSFPVVVFGPQMRLNGRATRVLEPRVLMAAASLHELLESLIVFHRLLQIKLFLFLVFFHEVRFD